MIFDGTRYFSSIVQFSQSQSGLSDSWASTYVVRLLNRSSEASAVMVLLQCPFSEILPGTSSNILGCFATGRQIATVSSDIFEVSSLLPRVTKHKGGLGCYSSVGSSSKSSGLISPCLGIRPCLRWVYIISVASKGSFFDLHTEVDNGSSSFFPIYLSVPCVQWVYPSYK